LYSFNARVSSNVQKLASHLNVLIREYNVIYRLIDDVKSELSLNMPVVDEDVQLGKGVVVQEFLYSEGNLKVPIAGSKVNTGKFDRNSLIKIIRGTDTVIRDVRLSSLKQKKDEVSMVTQGKECGLRLQGDPVRFEPNDEVIFYEKRKAARTIDWDPGF
jgi:translation initiation factor IF-2